MDDNRQINNNTYSDGTPKGWRYFNGLSFKVTKIPIDVTVLDLRDLFFDYGFVHKIEIETNDYNKSKGIAYVTFKFV
jgi:hypothetical protein